MPVEEDLERGARLREEGAWLEALAIHERLYEADPRDLQVREQVALTQAAAGHPERALPIAEALVAESPQDPRFRVALAAALASAGRYSEALAQLDPILERSPSRHDALLVRTEVSYGLHRHRDWMMSAKRCQETDPESPWSAFWLARMGRYLGQLPLAMGFAARAFELRPGFGLAYTELGLCLLQHEGAGERPWGCLKQGMNLAPHDGRTVGPMMLYELEQNGARELNLEDMERGARSVPHRGMPYYLARAHLVSPGDLERALDFARLAVESRPESVDSLLVLADVHSARGERAEARARFTRVLELSPSCPQAHRGLAQA